MNLRFVFLILAALAFGAINAQERSSDYSNLLKLLVDDDDNFTTVGSIGLTVSNFGTFGDGFVEQLPSDQPSCEYPKGSAIEHIFIGGLWVGAESVNGIRVSTGAFNIPSLSGGGAANFEYTNTVDENDLIIERSSLPANSFFSPEAISHQDFVADFSDTNTFIPGTGIPIPNHLPLGLGVHLESYAWNFPFADAFVILNYTITNVWDDPLQNVYVGLWADLVVRNTNQLLPRVGGPFYADVGVGAVDNAEFNMIYSYETDAGSINTGADSYVSLVFLGADAPEGDNLYQGEFIHNWWLFSGGSDDWERPPADEATRYARMQEFVSADALNRLPGNYMNLISTGPFERIDPGESVNVVFAVVCGRKNGSDPSSMDSDFQKQRLFENVGWAQRAYHGEDTNRNGVLDFIGTDSTEDTDNDGTLDRYILPTPPTPPILKTIPDNGKVTLLWDDSSERSVDLILKVRDFEGYRVYRSFLGGDLSGTGIFDNMQLIHEYDQVDGIFYDTGLESVRLPEPITEITTNPETGLQDTVNFWYKLEIDNLHNGWQYAFSVSAFDSGNVALNLPSLESSRLTNAAIVSPGTPAVSREQREQREIGVYPNPYKVNALWDGGLERQRKLHFYNLPRNSEVRIYSLSGDQVGTFIHNGDTYTGQGIQWYDNFSEGNTLFPGGEHAWDLVSEADQAIATGLYLFTVKDLDSGEVYKGKFVVIK